MILVLALAGHGCGPRLDHYVCLDRRLSAGDYDTALSILRESRDHYRDADTALYLMEEGLLAHYAGRFDESNRSLLQAEARLEELYTRSLSRQAASLWINDNTVPFRGEDFEDALVNLFLALNYAGLGLYDEALVEARQVDIELMQLTHFSRPASTDAYREDAFIRFIMGVLYESEGQLDDAFIAFRKAETIYRNAYLPAYGVATPAVVLEKLLRAAAQLGFEEEILHITAEYPGIEYPPLRLPPDSAEIFFLHYNGPGPQKIETFCSVPMPDGYVVKIAHPRFVVRDYAIAGSRLRLRNLDSGREYGCKTELMEPVGEIAAASLEQRMEAIQTRALARATAKYLTTRALASAAGKESGDSTGALVQFLGNVISVATENADLRHWRLLPDEIRFGRARIPAGGYAVHIDYVDDGGAKVSSQTGAPFRVAPGEKKFILKRTLQ